MSEDVVEDDAVRRAREVVGLYGDPATTWGICLELVLSEPVDTTGLPDRLAALVARSPHLGPAPVPLIVDAADWTRAREAAAAAEFGEDGLVRVLLSADGRRVFLAAHHGVVDGLGMLGIGEAVTAAGLRFRARGIGDRPARAAFLWSSVVRLAEALFSPPARFSGTESRTARGEFLGEVTTEPLKAGSAVMMHATARAYGRWPRRRNSGGRRFLIAMGVSRREPGVAEADRQTAYLRLRVDPRASLEEVRRTLAATEPEPDFPETSAGGIGPVVMRLLRNRLGATTTISNLGVVEGEGLVSCTMWPALNGPRACGIGVVTTGQCTTLSLRTRRSDFSQEEAERLLDLLLTELRSAQKGS